MEAPRSTGSPDASATPRGRAEAPGGSRRVLVGNLDGELEYARLAAAERRSGGLRVPPDGRFALPPAVLKSISALATLLRGAARDGDLLWLPCPVESRRLAEAPGLGKPLQVSGPEGLAGLAKGEAPPERAMAWVETPSVAMLREALARATPACTTPACEDEAARLGASSPPSGFVDLLWGVSPSADAARRANRKALPLEIRCELAADLPGSLLVRSTEELEWGLRDRELLGAAAGHWVLKAPFAASGRSRLLGRGDRASIAEIRRAERLLAYHGELILEPWMERSADFGASAILARGALRALPPHRLLVDPRGEFRGIALGSGDPSSIGLAPEEAEALARCVERVGSRLASLGYEGAFTVDAWRYRDSAGNARFQPLGEVNARWSFGLVARILRERLVAGGAAAEDATMVLRVGRGAWRMPPDPATRVVPLLLPGERDPTSAWAELSSS